MFDNSNPYTLNTEIVEGITRYYVSFADGQANHYELEIPHSVYLEFQRFVKVERNLRRWDERHREYSELTDEALDNRAMRPQKSVEDAALGSLQSGQLQLAIQSLPEIQRRRFILYYEFGLTYEQIAGIENCTFQVIARSIKTAENKIKKYFQK